MSISLEKLFWSRAQEFCSPILATFLIAFMDARDSASGLEATPTLTTNWRDQTPNGTDFQGWQVRGTRLLLPSWGVTGAHLQN